SDLFCGECGTKLSHKTNTTNETKNKPNYASEQNSMKYNATQISTHDSTQSNHKNEQFSKHTTDIFNEAKTFFSTAFRHPDKELVSPHFFSYKTLFSLIIAGLLLSIILLTILIPAEVAYFMTSKASVVFNIYIFLFIVITVLFFITFSLIYILYINFLYRFSQLIYYYFTFFCFIIFINSCSKFCIIPYHYCYIIYTHCTNIFNYEIQPQSTYTYACHLFYIYLYHHFRNHFTY